MVSGRHGGSCTSVLVISLVLYWLDRHAFGFSGHGMQLPVVYSGNGGASSPGLPEVQAGKGL